MTTPHELSSAVLEAERVRLRPHEASDAPAVFALIHKKREILDWLCWQGPETPESLLPQYSPWAQRDGSGIDYRLAIVERASGELCGSISARFKSHPYEADIGYWLGTPYWGRGLASEAVRLVTWLCFRPLSSALCRATVFEGNEASFRVLVNNGYEEQPEHAAEVRTVAGARRSRRFALPRSRWLVREAEWEPALADVELRAQAPR